MTRAAKVWLALAVGLAAAVWAAPYDVVAVAAPFLRALGIAVMTLGLLGIVGVILFLGLGKLLDIEDAAAADRLADPARRHGDLI